MECKICGRTLNPRATSGLCKTHFIATWAADPEIKAKQKAGFQAWVKANPEALRRRNIKVGQTKRANPELRARCAEFMRTVCQPASTTPECLANRDNAKRGRAISAARLAHIPPEYRDDYKYMVRYKLITKAEATRMILERAAIDKARAEAKLSPFERQERALRNGAAIVANDSAPQFGQAIDYGEGKWARVAG